MNTRSILTLCTVLVFGGAFMGGSANAENNAGDLMSKHVRHVEMGGNLERASEKLQHSQQLLGDHSSNMRAPVSVPEPSTLALFSIGFVGLALWHFRKHRAVTT
jgi:hypothetical protein